MSPENPPISLLIVDDEPGNFDVIEILLFKESYQLSYVPNGSEALAYLEQHQPDVILLDVMMPGLNGFEVCRHIKAQPQLQHIPVIMVTALNTKEDLAQCLDSGADDFVSKPVNGVELRARVRSMLRIKQQYDALKTLMQVREDLVNMIVHDLRNPLSSITLSCEFLKLLGLDEKPLRKIQQIGIAGQQLQSLIDSLLIMAKLESGKMDLNLLPADLRIIASMALEDFEAIAAQKNIQLINDLPKVEHTVFIDSPIFRRIFDNLLSNAIKFSPSGSQVTLKIDYPVDKQTRISVADLGPGVSKELRQQIFDKFDIGSIIRGAPQTGLGLAFCKMAIEAHGGSIFVEDNQPRGSVFIVEL
ncbi:hybrid sensor histidine kinase/response regulator [Leptolyngbya sp. 'hensonii']|uniref:ATP-binding response regulator n=1 Tax=Leptolyngbya sp. 'hensonii' TaxID=1922337 RepID=UPI0009502D9D|nr:response regulator [Leptolyngbya sp. 'hensonii']OLP19642.1 hybrid sensor histidine kinase/response regulator [Leptolyngbya sp. 'hensonii']